MDRYLQADRPTRRKTWIPGACLRVRLTDRDRGRQRTPLAPESLRRVRSAGSGRATLRRHADRVPAPDCAKRPGRIGRSQLVASALESERGGESGRAGEQLLLVAPKRRGRLAGQSPKARPDAGRSAAPNHILPRARRAIGHASQIYDVCLAALLDRLCCEAQTAARNRSAGGGSRASRRTARRRAAPAAQQAAEEKPSLAQRFFASFPHPGDGARRMPVDDDKRDKDNDF